MQYFGNEISTGYALNAAYMSYTENEAVTDILQNNADWEAFQEEYNENYRTLERMLGEAFPVVDSLLNSLRAMCDIESELFYRIGMRDGVSFTRGDVILDNLGGV